MDTTRKRPPPDFGPLPADDDAFVPLPKICGQLGGCSQVTARKMCDGILLPILEAFAENRVGVRAGPLRRSLKELPARLAAREVVRGRRAKVAA